VETPSGRFRRLVPVELEQLSGFPKKHTDLPGLTDARRAFFIGNALVTGIVEKLAITIKNNEFL
jgi:DNA (cytosine-5)-methyltransferase 1